MSRYHHHQLHIYAGLLVIEIPQEIDPRPLKLNKNGVPHIHGKPIGRIINYTTTRPVPQAQQWRQS